MNTKHLDKWAEAVGEQSEELLFTLFDEEHRELEWTITEYFHGEEPLEELLKEFLDVVWTGTAYFKSKGIDVDAAFDELARSNFSKLDGGELKRREDGKILKPHTYSPPRFQLSANEL